MNNTNGYDINCADIPDTLKASSMLACKRCTLLKTYEQFMAAGCDNCGMLKIEGDSDRVSMCTSNVFSGIISMMEPKKTWVGKWQRIANFKPGVYAVEVIGELPQSIKEDLIDEGYSYRVNGA